MLLPDVGQCEGVDLGGQHTRVGPILGLASRGRDDSVAAGRCAVSRRQARRPSAVASQRTGAPRASSWLLMACGIWLVGLGAYCVFLRPALLPEDPRFIGVPLERLREVAPGLEAWLRIVFTVMGFMAGTGLLTVHLTRTALRERHCGTGWVVAFAGLTTVGLMSAMNFVLQSDFRWLLLLPALLWALAVVLYVRRA